ncbi:hypothetical protein ABGN05_27865 [Aquibium sp. LZ166]|uniref:DUF202 domain-containing protein n=1 Tax=Aquibium pacificus TaxID=3153579 RepID=A0ABV3STF2_9HYPH
MADDNHTKIKSDLLLVLYRTEIEQGRHHEILRSNISSYLNGFAAALIAAISFQDSIDKQDIPLGSLLLALGIFGIVVNLKHYERFRKHVDRAGAYRRELLQANNLSEIEKIRRNSDEKTEKRFRFLNNIRLYHLWTGVFLFHIFMGIYVVVRAFG